MPQVTSVKHVNNLIQNLQEVRRLVDIHQKLTGSKRGNQSSVNVLNKSGVVLVVACWEAFIEDLAQIAFEKLLAAAGNHSAFTDKVLALASSDLKKCEDDRRVWELAGDGWKNVLKEHKDKIIEKYLGNFNTAKTEQINKLFESLVGIKLISSNWHWQGVSSRVASSRLDSIVQMRGEIAHRMKTNEPILKKHVEDSLDFIQKLAAITSNRVSTHIARKSKNKKYPWSIVHYRNRG